MFNTPKRIFSKNGRVFVSVTAVCVCFKQSRVDVHFLFFRKKKEEIVSVRRVDPNLWLRTLAVEKFWFDSKVTYHGRYCKLDQLNIHYLCTLDCKFLYSIWWNCERHRTDTQLNCLRNLLRDSVDTEACPLSHEICSASAFSQVPFHTELMG